MLCTVGCYVGMAVTTLIGYFRKLCARGFCLLGRLFCISKIRHFGVRVNVPVDLMWGTNFEKGPSGRVVEGVGLRPPAS